VAALRDLKPPASIYEIMFMRFGVDLQGKCHPNPTERIEFIKLERIREKIADEFEPK